MKLYWVLLVLVVACYSKKGVDVSVGIPKSVFDCFKRNGIQLAVVRAFQSFGVVDPKAVFNLENAKAAGIPADIYMFPCRSRSPQIQVDSLIRAIPNGLYNRVWINIESNPSQGCSWNGLGAAPNCQYITQLAQTLIARGKKIGIKTSKRIWESITDSCRSVSTHPLWYANYDNKQNFSDYVFFNGWLRPTMKQYKGATSLCAAPVNLNWFP